VGKSVVLLEWPEPGNSLLSTVLGDLVDRVQVDPFRDDISQSLEEACRDAEIVCFHIDLTLRRGLPLQVANLSRRLRDQGRFVVNGDLQDISKVALAKHLKSIHLPTCEATRRGPADEALFIKTNLNFGGRKEKTLPSEIIESSNLATLVSREIDSYSYRTLARKDVPDDAWADRALFIERFVTNPADSFVRAYFSGVQIIMVVAYARGPIKKLAGDPRDTNYVTNLEHLKGGAEDFALSDSLKATVCRFVEETPVEFGCIDIVHDDLGRYYIVDLNPTPSGGVGMDHELNEYLRLGITDPDCRKGPGWAESPLI
jgi:hypothetical protein